LTRGGAGAADGGAEAAAQATAHDAHLNIPEDSP